MLTRCTNSASSATTAWNQPGQTGHTSFRHSGPVAANCLSYLPIYSSLTNPSSQLTSSPAAQKSHSSSMQEHRLDLTFRDNKQRGNQHNDGERKFHTYLLNQEVFKCCFSPSSTRRYMRFGLKQLITGHSTQIPVLHGHTCMSLFFLSGRTP